MKEKSRREVISLLAAGAAATAVGMLSKDAAAQERDVPEERKKLPARAMRQYLNLTIALGPKAPGMSEQLIKAINETLEKHGGGGKIGGGVGPQSEWAQDGGWFQDLQDPWGQSGGWVRDLNGRFTRLSGVDARSNAPLVNVRDSLRKVELKETGVMLMEKR